MLVDIFREVPYRIIGFSFGFAEAAKYRFSMRTVRVIQGIGTVFVIAHVANNGLASDNSKLLPVLNAICFEGICSILIPTFINARLCRLVADGLWDMKSLPFFIRRTAPFVAGVLTLPILLGVVDPGVIIALDAVFPLET